MTAGLAGRAWNDAQGFGKNFVCLGSWELSWVNLWLNFARAAGGVDNIILVVSVDGE